MLGYLEISQLRQNFHLQALAWQRSRRCSLDSSNQSFPATSRTKSRYRRASPRPFQIDHARDFAIAISMLDSQRTADDFGKIGRSIPRRDSPSFKIGIRPVGLQHGEFRIVLPRNALVAEVAADLENFVEPAYEQSF